MKIDRVWLSMLRQKTKATLDCVAKVYWIDPTPVNGQVDQTELLLYTGLPCRVDMVDTQPRETDFGMQPTPRARFIVTFGYTEDRIKPAHILLIQHVTPTVSWTRKFAVVAPAEAISARTGTRVLCDEVFDG